MEKGKPRNGASSPQWAHPNFKKRDFQRGAGCLYAVVPRGCTAFGALLQHSIYAFIYIQIYTYTHIYIYALCVYMHTTHAYIHMCTVHTYSYNTNCFSTWSLGDTLFDLSEGKLEQGRWGREREESAGMAQGKLPLRKHLKTAQMQCHYGDPANFQIGLSRIRILEDQRISSSWVSKLSAEISFCVGKIRWRQDSVKILTTKLCSWLPISK